MIIVRSPLRITLGGGGTDLPSYYRVHEGFLVAAAIDKYIYITIYDPLVSEIVVRYLKNERVATVDEIEHPIVREAMKMVGIHTGGIEIVSAADIPGGTGLGSSGTFTTALLKALYAHQREMIHPEDLAEKACQIEIEKLGEPIGKQDQYIAAYGGVTSFKFLRNDKVIATPVRFSQEQCNNLEDSLMLFFTGVQRSASSILKDQNEKTKNTDEAMISNLHYVKELGYRSQAALEGGNLDEFGALMHEQWLHKKKRSGGMSTSNIDEWYDLGLKNGATGGKLIGAGGGGFLMFHTNNKQKLRHAMLEARLKEIRFRFDFEGTKVVSQ